MRAPCERGPARASRLPIVTLALGLVVVALQSVPGSAAALGLRVGEVRPQELWRLVSCHVVHWSWAHASWDLFAFVILGVVCERGDRRRFLFCLGSAAVAIAVVVTFSRPELTVYAGLSGLDMALFGLALSPRFRERPAGGGRGGRVVLLLGVAALVGKLAYELTSGATLLFQPAAAGFVPVPEAHLVGALVGLAWGWAPTLSLLRPGKPGYGVVRTHLAK